MTDDTRVLRLLREHLETLPTEAPSRMLQATLGQIERSGSRPRRPGLFGRWYALPWPTRRVMLVGFSASLLIAGLLGVSLLPFGHVPQPSPSPIPSPGATPTAVPAARLIETDLLEVTEFVPYSSRLNPWLTFEVGCGNTGCRNPFSAEFCPIGAIEGKLTFPHARGCAATLSVIRPDAVDCRTADPHPGAEALAAAILANEHLHARDLGNLRSAGAVPADLFAESYSGRVVQTFGSPTASGVDPARCHLLLKPSLGQSPIEVRADEATTLVLVEIGGQLFVVRVVQPQPDGGVIDDATQLDHLLALIHHVRFLP